MSNPLRDKQRLKPLRGLFRQEAWGKFEDLLREAEQHILESYDQVVDLNGLHETRGKRMFVGDLLCLKKIALAGEDDDGPIDE